MPIDADLGKIELKTSETTETVESDVIKIESFDDAQKKKLDAEFAKSEVGKSFKSKLEEIKSDVKTAEGKKNDMVTFLKDYFEVGDNKDEQIKRFVVNGKSYLRINDGKNSFDVELSDALMPSLVDWFLATSEAQINEGITKEEDKIKLKYEKEKEFIKKTQAELLALKGQVTAPAGDDESFRDMLSMEKFKKYGKEWGSKLKNKITGFFDGVKSAVSSVYEIVTDVPNMIKGFSLGGLFGKKDGNETPAK